MADLATLTAEELMVLYQRHSPDEAFLAFNELYSRYGQRTFHFLNKKLHNQADSEDLLQKVFIKIHESKHLYKEKYKFEQWLFVIARSQVLDHFRKDKRYQERLRNYSPESSIMAQEPSSALFVNDLSADQQELLEMRYIDGLSYEEISKLVNKSEVSLRKSLSRIVSRLKRGEVQ